MRILNSIHVLKEFSKVILSGREGLPRECRLVLISLLLQNQVRVGNSFPPGQNLHPNNGFGSVPTLLPHASNNHHRPSPPPSFQNHTDTLTLRQQQQQQQAAAKANLRPQPQQTGSRDPEIPLLSTALPPSMARHGTLPPQGA